MKDKILVNDIIKVKFSEHVDSYSFYDSWFWAYGISTDNQYGTPLSKHIKSFDESYECIWTGPHLTTGEQLYAIAGLYSHKIFLIDSNSIKRYYHTCNSYDNTEDALRLISNQYNNLLIDLEEARKENDRLALKIAAPHEEPMPENPMPPLEDGMYGIIVDNRCEHKNYKFRVAHGCIFMDNGWVYGVDDFEDGFYNDLDIVEISTGVESFDQYHYGTVVWTIVYNES